MVLSVTEEQVAAQQDQGARGTALAVSSSLLFISKAAACNNHFVARMRGGRETMSAGNKRKHPQPYTTLWSSLWSMSLRQQKR